MKRKPTQMDNVYILLAILIMIGLYISSSMGYEDQNVQPLLHQWLENEPLRGFLEQFEFSYAGSPVSINSSGYFGFIEFFIRKGAHFVIFFFLGLFWFLGLRHRVDNIYLTLFLAVLLTAGYASFDELRQAFHPNRTALMEDVILDTVGGTVGILMAFFSGNTTKKKNRLRFTR